MKNCILALTLAFTACCFAQSTPKSFNTESVIALVKAGMSESIVISAIDSQPGQYSLSASDLIALKQAGASDKILAAMIKKSSSSNQTATTTPSQVAIQAMPVTDVRTIFISGNNETAADTRRDLLKIADRYPDSACFTILDNRHAANAILDLAESDTSGGSGGFFGGNNRETTVASATLTDQQGNLLWSDSKQGMQGMFHTGAGDAGGNLLRSLFKTAGCRSNGERVALSAKNSHR